jgi:hypothetical protein
MRVYMPHIERKRIAQMNSRIAQMHCTHACIMVVMLIVITSY